MSFAGKSISKAFVGAVISTLFAFSASAQNYDLGGRWGVGGGLGVSTALQPKAWDNSMDGGLAASFWARYHYNSRLGVELAYNRLQYDYKASGSGSDPLAQVLDLSVAYRAWPTNRLHMLVQLGIGYVNFSNLGKTYKDLAMKARLGAEYMATENWALAINADYYYMNLGSGSNSNFRTLVPLASLTYYFGGSSHSAPAPVAATPVISVSDSDGDGVSNADDKCPGTAAGEKVNEFGCAPTEKMEFTLNIQFANGSSKVDEAYVADIQKLAEFMTKNPTVRAEIEGHTDNTGSEKLNFSISQKRAAAVRTYLITKLKIDKSRLTAKGYGPSQPVADNATPEGRTKNRRVVAHVKAN
jgi:OmpA-OmpF porin, OOP family